jgi:hypothetical protein
MKGQWIIKEVYFEDGWPSVIRDPIREIPSDVKGKTWKDDWKNKETSVFVNFQLNEVSPLEFVKMVTEKEHLTGIPIIWAQWPNRARGEK